MSEWFYARENQQYGPIPSPALKEMCKAGQLAPSDLIWRQGMVEWVEARRIKGLFEDSSNAVFAPPGSAPVPQAAAMAAIPVMAADGANAGNPIAYATPVTAIGVFPGMHNAPAYAQAALKSFPPVRGDADEWPLSVETFNVINQTNGHRRIIRGMAIWYRIAGWITVVYTAVITLISLYAFLNVSRRRYQGPELALLLAVAMMAGMSGLCFSASRATHRCKRWAPLTMMIIYILGAVSCVASMLMISFSPQAEAAVGATMSMLVTTCFMVILSVLSGKAFVAIPKFLNQPAWAVATLVGCGL